MNIKRYMKNGVQVLRVTEDLGIRSHLAPLREAVQGHMEKGVKHIALSFTPNSYLSSESVAVCVQCVELARERGTNLAIIRPNEQMREVLDLTDLSHLVTFCASENELSAE